MPFARQWKTAKSASQSKSQSHQKISMEIPTLERVTATSTRTFETQSKAIQTSPQGGSLVYPRPRRQRQIPKSFLSSTAPQVSQSAFVIAAAASHPRTLRTYGTTALRRSTKTRHLQLSQEEA